MLAHSDMDGTLTPDTDRSVSTVLEEVEVEVEVDISIF